MSDTTASPTSTGPRRLWLPVILVAMQAVCLVLPYQVEFENVELMFGLMMLGPMVASGGVLLWWLFLSGIAWRDRLLVLLVGAVAAGGAFGLSHETFRMALALYGLAALSTLWVGYLLLTAWMNWPVRRAGLMLTLLLAAVGCTLLRMDGVWGDFQLQLSYRFRETAEDRYVKGSEKESAGPASAPAAPVRLAAGDWPGFRGAARDARVVGVSIPTDWEKNPPKQLWKRPIGPGWSSFAVVGDRVYTQEQRGPDEAVVCLDADTGKQVWAHKDEARFSEAIAGAGPRATPTFHDGKVYALGAKGTLNCLDAATGKKVWSKDIAEDSGAKPPPGGWWGFCSSPLVASGVVTVVASFTDGKCVLGYKADSGELAWTAGKGKHTYSSAQLATLAGVEQILVPADDGLSSYDPATGKVLWQHEWVGSMPDMARCTQPAVVSKSDVLFGTGFKHGMRRLSLRPKPDGWSDETLWTSKAISPYFNDMVVHQGHIYGFDDSFFTCVNLENGEKSWRARGYGNGQVVLLADQGLLVILTERGDVALVKADPEKHTVLGRLKAIEGKTWNHPVVAHGKLFVRNGEEVACYRLAPESDGSPTK
jgi:outer membrane protein assembly factor BamB